MARTEDSPASKQAAVDALDFGAAHRLLILGALADVAPRGMTAKQIERFTKLTNVQVSRRIAEMRRTGHVVTFDGQQKPGHASPDIREEGCHLHVLAQHQAAAAAIYEGQIQRAAARRMLA